MSFDRHSDSSSLFRVCFVCTGNICRSPMAEVVFRDLVARRGMESSVTVTSAGTGDWHVGEQADRRTLAALSARGYDPVEHRAKQFDRSWFDRFDLIVAFDRSHERTLRAWAVDDADRAKIHLLLSFDPAATAIDVPDPYYSDASLFEGVLTMIERASAGLISQIEPAIRQGVA
ncbi:MAG: low molecular weight phosphotyrosine protein phosphatase [Actinomycetota bacterium]|nr:low molecular weight phosphotyrosine protein phosphatase [Actinomycetota bacterium]